MAKSGKARSTKRKRTDSRTHRLQATEFKQVQGGKVDIATPSRRIGKEVINNRLFSKTYEGRTLIKDFYLQI